MFCRLVEACFLRGAGHALRALRKRSSSMNFCIASHFSPRLSRLTFLFTLIACLVGFAGTQERPKAPFAGAVRIPAGTAAETGSNALGAQTGVEAVPDIQTTHGDSGSVNVGEFSATHVALAFTFDASV